MDHGSLITGERHAMKKVYNKILLLNNLFFMYTPPIGDPKQLDTPTAQAAANISVFLDSFYKFNAKDK